MHAVDVRWGILGVAKINERLLPAFRKASNAKLAAIASRGAERARTAATQGGIPRWHASYEALLGDPGIDAVYIPLPNSLHEEWTLRAADRGKHVLCEKPLAPQAAQAQRMVNYCRGKGVQLMDGFMWPHHPRSARIKQVLTSGRIGEVRRVAAAFTFPLGGLDPANIRLRPELGGGSLLDVGCYPVFGIRWAFGVEPIRAFAAARYANGVDVEMTGLVEFEGSRSASFDCGFTMPYRGWLEITGTEGIVGVPDMWLPGPKANFVIRHEGRGDEEVAVEGEDQIVHMIENFGRAILEGMPLMAEAEESVQTLRTLDALARAARENQAVAIRAE